MEKSRSVIFGRDAGTYDSSRPAYPAAAVDHVRGLVDAKVALEVGAGTGKATVDIARPDLSLTCVEPSPQMAEILSSKRLPGVDVVVSTYEEWDGEADSLDLIIAAQAWHWVDHETAYKRALGYLRPGGVLALMWNIPHDRYTTFEAVYLQHAPGLLAERDRRIQKRDSVTWGDDMSAAGFAEVGRFTHRWTDTLAPDGVRALYSTYSDHMMLPDGQRERLLGALGEAVEQRGGTVTFDYRTEVFSGRKI